MPSTNTHTYKQTEGACNEMLPHFGASLDNVALAERQQNSQNIVAHGCHIRGTTKNMPLEWQHIMIVENGKKQ